MHRLTAYSPSIVYPHPKLFMAWIGFFVGLSVLLIYSNRLQVQLQSFTGLPVLAWHKQKSVSREPSDESKASQPQNDPHAVSAAETLLIETKQHTGEC